MAEANVASEQILKLLFGMLNRVIDIFFHRFGRVFVAFIRNVLISKGVHLNFISHNNNLNK